jgi:putative transcriptional regulator
MKMKKNSRILEAVYETARDLHACGLLTEERMKLYNELCLEPVTLYLEHDVAQYLNEICQADPEKLSVFVNDLLRKNIETEQRLLS